MVQVQCMDPRSNNNYNFLYCPSFPAAVIFTALFGLVTLAHLILAVHYRKRFCWVVVMAGSWETAGFLLRVFAVLHTTSQGYGTPSQILILLSPLWINAFLYVLMARFVWFFVPEKRVAGISAQRLSLLFVLLDISAFIMQAAGGLLINSDTPKIAQLGIHIYMGGIGLQQFFISDSSASSCATTTGCVKSRRAYGRRPRGGARYISCVYSPLTMHEAPLYTLEALPMFVALALWCFVHPGTFLVGPESEFPKKESKKERRRRLAEEAETAARGDEKARDPYSSNVGLVSAGEA